MDIPLSKKSKHQRPRYGMTLLLFSTLATGCESFVQPQFAQHRLASVTQLQMTAAVEAEALPDLSEILEGESCLESSTKEFLETAEAPLTAVDGAVSEISTFAPPLTYDKFLTMQSKRVPVSVRYSEKSGLRPYYLTVAKKIKEAYPDVVLDKIILPKVEASGMDNNNHSIEGATFEVVVDGKIVVRWPSRKGSFGENIHVFVNMHEVEAAVCRARKRRRPQTVYGEDDSDARLKGILKNKNNANEQKQLA
ncbi:MAG: hypothetical protein SGBAC_007511 [Bacillariaceae sp.]